MLSWVPVAVRNMKWWRPFNSLVPGQLHWGESCGLSPNAWSAALSWPRWQQSSQAPVLLLMAALASSKCESHLFREVQKSLRTLCCLLNRVILFVDSEGRIQAFRNVLPFYFWTKFLFLLNCVGGTCEHSGFGICRWTIKVNIEVEMWFQKKNNSAFQKQRHRLLM